MIRRHATPRAQLLHERLQAAGEVLMRVVVATAATAAVGTWEIERFACLMLLRNALRNSVFMSNCGCDGGMCGSISYNDSVSC